VIEHGRDPRRALEARFCRCGAERGALHEVLSTHRALPRRNMFWGMRIAGRANHSAVPRCFVRPRRCYATCGVEDCCLRWTPLSPIVPSRQWPGFSQSIGPVY